MKNYLLLKTCLGVLTGLSLTASAQPQWTIFQDDFENGMGAWGLAGTTLDWSVPGTNQIPAGGLHSAYLNSSGDRMYHNLPCEVLGTATATWWIYDAGTISTAATRAFGEIRCNTGGGYGQGTLETVYAIGKYGSTTLPGEPWVSTKYQGRIQWSTNGNMYWFNLNGPGSPNRSVGWHRFDIERIGSGPGTVYNFYVDGILSRVCGPPGSPIVDKSWDTILIGSVAAGTTTGDAWFDGVGVVQPQLQLTCPANIVVQASGPGGALVNYSPPTVSGGCPPVTVNCNPPSGSMFPIGVTAVVCAGNDVCGQVASCTFMVTVVAEGAKEYFFKTKLLPPPDGVYVTPAMWHAAFNSGIMIRDVRHRAFTASIEPPALGAKVTHSFGSQVEMDVSQDGGLTWARATAPAGVGVSIQHTSDTGGVESYDTEMLGLNVSGGGLPASIQIRESPTRAGTGGTTARPVEGGFMVSSFFDIFIEVSTDSISWEAASVPAHVELRPDPALVTELPVPTRLLPPPVDNYVSPADYHIALANGIIIKDVKHKLFTQSANPPLVGEPPVTHHFDSQLDFQLSYNGGLNWQPVSAPAGVDVQIQRLGSGEEELYETEMIGLTIGGGTLPASIQIRESPTEPSRGMTSIKGGGGGGGGGAVVQSFFDIFLEVSLDGGASWNPPTNGPARMEAKSVGPADSFPTDLLPPPEGQYISPERWHALYAQGIIISNVIHKRFTQGITPPPVGQTASHSFGSQVEMDVSIDHGASFMHVIAPAGVQVRITGSQDDGSTRYFETEMEMLEITGGLPGGIMIRESPTRASTGRTSISFNGLDNDCDSFFDIFIEVSTDGGASWAEPTTGPATMTLQRVSSTPLSITCPPNQQVRATSPAGAVVTYPPPTVSGGTPPITVNCVPPSGSTFPIGVTQVNCVATDAGGQTAQCGFTVTVLRQLQKRFFQQNLLPPTNGMYISPQQWHAYYANGIIISNVAHRIFTQGVLPPPTSGGSLTHSFGSQVEMEVSMDGGLNWQSCVANATVQVNVINNGSDAGDNLYGVQMLQLNLSGGSLPAGVMIRESPTLASSGQTRIQAIPGGYMIDSFFDIFTEVSTDNGGTWMPASQSARMELKVDPALIPPVLAPRTVSPMPNGQYISPQQWHQLYASGIIIRDVKHKLFTQWMEPPLFGASQTHTFDSQLDFQLSVDGGNNWTVARAPGVMTVSSKNIREISIDEFTRHVTYEMEVQQLDIAGGGLPAGVMIRESPTRASQGGTAMTTGGGGGGGAGGGAAISSFFDIFTEVTTDGGGTWGPATNGPAHVELERVAPVHEFPSNVLPPPAGEYISPQQWHAYYANGIVISNVVHRRFTQSIPPPPPGMTTSHTFGSQVEMEVSMNGGGSWQHVSAPANVGVQITCRLGDDGVTEYYDTEMTQLSISGGGSGGLPAGVMIRESPTKASLGRTTISTSLAGYQMDSFFDIFTEVSMDGGQTWQPSLGSPATMVLQPVATVPLSITCPPNQVVRATSPAGAVVNYPPPTVSGGCPPITVNCNPPSGSTFPIGVTTVTCLAFDTCGQQATCTFTVTVRPQVPPWFFRVNLLPPANGMYISPQQWHALYANGIIINNVIHRRFTGGILPPPPGGSATHSFGSEVEFQVSTDNGATFQAVVGTANATVHISNTGGGTGGLTYDTEMLALDISGAPGLLIRESPTRPSTGQTHILPVTGGYMIDSFFDIFTEVSTDGGASWTPAADPATVELRIDPTTVPAVEEPTDLLPPPVDNYVSPADWHAAFANGIIIRDVKHKIFTGSVLPAPIGQTATHTFDSQVDMMVSLDGGGIYRPMRAPAVAVVRQSHYMDSGGVAYLDTEMLALDIRGGDLPAGVMIRESPTRASQGGASVAGGGGGAGKPMVSSFFDIFTELSTDGGGTWQPPTNGPAHVELAKLAPPHDFPDPTLPPATGEYVSPQQWHAYYAQGIVISNVIHKRFTQTIPPPPPGGSQMHSFSSQIEMMLSTDGGATFNHVIAPANVTVHITSRQDEGSTRYFDTEMLQLDISGGGLPGGIMIRESPTKASLGRVSEEALPTGGMSISSFFDIFTEVSMDGGQTWQPSLGSPATMVLQPVATVPLSITCPPNQVAQAAGPGGAVVVYPPPTASGGTPPITVTCTPPSGSHFRVGPTPVTCVAKDAIGQTAQCTFTVKVLPPKRFFRAKLLPPGDGMYISPQQWHALYANGIIVSNVIHKRFTQGIEPPPPGMIVTHSFSSEVQLEVAMAPNQASQPYSAMADVTVRISRSLDPGTEEVYDTEMLQLDLHGGSLPPQVQIRESPTLASSGETHIVPVAGGFMVSSFFDVFTELSTDGGSTWSPSRDSAAVELTIDPTTVPPVNVPTDLLPPLVHKYVSPQDWHVAFANGIVISDVRHAVFTGAILPPPYGMGASHTFDSQVDMLVSTGMGAPTRMRAPAVMTVAAQHVLDFTDTQYLETEALQLDVAGGDMPAGFRLRESPTLPSRGGASIQGGGGGAGKPMSSFFDIWVELSTDGGSTWSPATSGPVRVELQTIAPEAAFQTPGLPPQQGEYVSPPQWHAYYAQGIIISNVIHRRFTQSIPPPPPGGSQTHTFDSEVDMMVFIPGGAGWRHMVAPAQCQVRITSLQDQDTTRYFDTEMLALNISGGGLPGGVMVRESPTKASTGRTSMRSLPIGSMISSFFDVFTELSMDGGQTWQPSQTGPATVYLRPQICEPPVIIDEPDDVTAHCFENATFCVVATGTPPLSYQWSVNGLMIPNATDNCLVVKNVTMAQNGNIYQVVVANLCGSATSRQALLTVIDVTPPLIVCPADLVVGTDPGRCDAQVQYPLPQAADDCGIVTNVTCTPKSGSVFPLGTTTVVCSAYDQSGNSSSCTFHIIVVDREWPVITCPADVVANTDLGTCAKSNVTYTATATDNCPNVQVVCDPPSGSTFQRGIWLVTCTATDGAGNSTRCVFTVTIRDLEPPAITCPGNLSFPTDPGECSKHNVTYAPRVTDNCPDLLPPPVCQPPSGSTFPLGVTTVLCTATDGSGNSSSCTFTVTVRDLEAPSILCPPSVVYETDPGTCAKTNVTYTATATDNCPNVTVKCVPPSGSTFGLGTGTVTCTATDGSGNTASCSFTVTVRDTEPPIIICPPDMIVKAYARTGTIVNYPPPTVTDNCAVLKTNCAPPSGSIFPLGVTVVTCSATDSSGNESRCSFKVTVNLVGLETDRFNHSVARLALSIAGGPEQELTLAGPTEVQVFIGPNGECIDLDGDGRDQALTEMTQLNLTGFAMPLGHIQLHLRPGTITSGEVEERQNGHPGTLDLSPFVALPVVLLADSFFDVFVEVQVDWPVPRTYHSDGPVHMMSVITHKPPAPNEAYTNATPVRLLDELGQPAYITLTRVTHVPGPKEVDVFPISEAFVTVKTPQGVQPITMFMRGPTTVEVAIPPSGWAADTDANGREEASMLMTELALQGKDPAGNPVMLRLAANPPTIGSIEERNNNTLGILDIAPFVQSPNLLLADSFFDVFFELDLSAQLPLHPEQPVHMVSVLTHKPPAPGETFTNWPPQAPIRLLWPDGTPSGYNLISVLHTPVPLPCPQLTAQLVQGGIELEICWKDDGRDCKLQYTSSLGMTPPIAWHDVTVPPAPAPPGYKCYRIAPMGAMKYFRMCGGCQPAP